MPLNNSDKVNELKQMDKKITCILKKKGRTKCNFENDEQDSLPYILSKGPCILKKKKKKATIDNKEKERLPSIIRLMGPLGSF